MSVRGCVGITVVVGWLLAGGSAMAAGSGTVTLIHIGDIHGHLTARANLRSDGVPSVEGGLARVYTTVQEIRKQGRPTLLVNSGDTIQGSAEVMFTRGQAIVDVLNGFKIDAYVPGNWDFVYGTERFTELFAGARPKAPWNTIAANLYFDGEPYATKTGQRALAPYLTREVGGLKIGLLGLTTDRGPQLVGRTVTQGFRFTKGDAEMKEFVKLLREQERVDLLVVVSELGLANNIRLAEATPGVDVILSSDMHETTREPVVTKTGTVIVEEGQDGTVVGELALSVKDGKVERWSWKAHSVHGGIREDAAIAAAVKKARKTFVSGRAFKRHVNPFNGTALPRPIDTVVGWTTVHLHRANFADAPMAAVIEGSSHDFLTDAFRVQGQADIGAIRGFRYGTHVPAGAIRMEDLYHFIPIGPMIARGTIKGQQLKNQIENSADGSLSPEIREWTGGWLFGFSGVTLDLDPYRAKGARASNIRVLSRETNTWAPLDPGATYTYASYYYYSRDADLINVVPATNVTVLKDEAGNAVDGVEVVVRYLQSLPDKTVTPELNRIRLLRPLPAPRFGNPEIQPLRGAGP